MRVSNHITNYNLSVRLYTIKKSQKKENKKMRKLTKLQVSVESGISADGIDISVFQDDELTIKKSYRYGYDASYGRSNNPARPYVGNIIQEYIKIYNITDFL